MNFINTLIILSLAVVSKVIGVQVCGRALADMLDLICNERGFHWLNTDVLPTITKRSANQYLSQTSGSLARRGVVTECCHKSCTLADMESYCATPSTGGPIIPTNLITNPPQPVHTTSRPQPTQTTPRPRPVPKTPRPLGPYALFGNIPFFFVRPVGPRPTRTPVVT